MLDPDRFPVIVPVEVAWGDMDAFRHVNNTVYLTWFETARIALFERIGFVSGDGVGPILARQTCIYRAPVTYPDTVDVGVAIEDVGHDRFTMTFQVRSRNLGALVAEGEGRIVSFDYALGHKAPLPDHVRDRLAALAP